MKSNISNLFYRNNDNGSITLYTLVAMVFLLTIAFTAYASAMTKLQGQNEELDAIKANYEKEINAESLTQLYNELTGTRQWLQGDGTELNPYKIYTIEDLVEFSNRTNKNTGAESFEGKYIELMNDIDFNNVTTYENADRTDFGDVNGDGQINGIKTELTTYEGFKPIGSKTAFMGTFKGNNNEIKNLYEDKKTLNVLGLFANINSAILQDLTVTGNITNTLSANAYTYEGGIVANATGNSTIKDVNNKVNVSNNFGNGAIAGIIGRCNGEINIENCCNAASINGSQHTGGIVGVTGNTVQIKKCENLGEVKSELRTDTRAGGIIGSASGIKIEVLNCNNNGSINGLSYAGGIIAYSTATKLDIESNCNNGRTISSSNAGGIIARIYSGETTIINSYNKIQVKGTSMVGGIVGYGTGSINNCSNNGEISINRTDSSDGRLGGIAGDTSGKIECCYNTGNIKANNTMNMGGIVGFYNTLTLENCYNTGELIGEDSIGRMGGIVARNNNGAKIKNCYNIGKLNRTGQAFGGINGWNYSPSTIVNSYSLNTSSNKAYNGSSTGVVNCTLKTEQEMKDATFVTLLDTDNEQSVWRADSNNINNGYPILKWQQ